MERTFRFIAFSVMIVLARQSYSSIGEEMEEGFRFHFLAVWEGAVVAVAVLAYGEIEFDNCSIVRYTKRVSNMFSKRCFMQLENVKDQLLQATIKLLTKSNDANKITARQIVAEANVNLAMINYYFTSKDALVSAAVDKMIANRATELEQIKKRDVPAKQRLIEFLLKLSDITVEYSQYTKSTIPYVLLEKDIEEPYHILPIVKECFGSDCSEMECRIIAYQLTTFSQIVFFRSDDFKKYAGIDIMDAEERKTLFHTMVDSLIQNRTE